jgi:hypothetical protein
LTDIYLLNGRPGMGPDSEPRDELTTTPAARNALYRNNGDWTFSDVTQQAGVGDTGHGLGVTVGDYNEDGHPDLYVNNFGPNVFYENNGDGTFRDVTLQMRVDCGNEVGAGTCFLDMDADGDLDLYVAHYIAFSYARHRIRAAQAYPYPPGPKDYHPVADSLFRNNGDGSFTDVSHASGIAAVAGPSMGMICVDYDADGDTDVFVCNDGAANFLFQNDGRGNFTEKGLLVGTAFNLHGDENGSMGVDSGDFDGDGNLDLFMTDYTAEMPVLYRGVAGGYFEDATNVAGAGTAIYPHTNWGTGFVDFDNDADCDLFIACGHFLSKIPEIDRRTSYRVKNCLMMNTATRRFVDVSDRCGNGLAVVESSRGAGFADLDNDGLQDVVILNANARPTILRNATQTNHHWLQIRLLGEQANRQAVGSRVHVVAGDRRQVAEVHSGRSYQSHYGTRLHFGLAGHNHVDRIEVHWHGGDVEVFEDVTADQLVLLQQGRGSP